MRMSYEEKQRTHGRIIENAARLVRERGLEGASVADIMRDAGLTHGGFYKHFDSKDALIESALDAAFADVVAMLDVSAADAFARYKALYLSRAHVDNPGRGCPVAALGQEVARGTPSLKATFGGGVQRIIDAAASRLRGSPKSRRRAAVRDMCMLVGAVVLARASDPATADEVLAACRDDRHEKQAADA